MNDEHPVAKLFSALLASQRSIEMCQSCGHVGPPGDHETVDLEGNSFPACEGMSRVQAVLWQTRTFWWEHTDQKKLAKGYAVR